MIDEPSTDRCADRPDVGPVPPSKSARTIARWLRHRYADGAGSGAVEEVFELPGGLVADDVLGADDGSEDPVVVVVALT